MNKDELELRIAVLNEETDATYYNSLTAEKIGLTLPESIIERGIDVSAE